MTTAGKPKVELRIDGDARGFTAATVSAQGALKRLGADLGRVQSLSAQALAGFGITANFAGLLALAKNAADTADNMGKLAQSTGVTVEELSRLEYAASLNNATLQDVSKALLKISQDAQSGGGKLAAFGVSLTDSAGGAKDANQLLLDIAERFASLPDGVTKSAAAVSLFGEEGAKLVPLLNNGSAGLKALADESDRFGKTISTSTALAAAEFNDNLTRLQSLAQATGQQVGVLLIPAMNDLAVAFLETVKADANLGGAGGLSEWAKFATNALAVLANGLQAVYRLVLIVGRVVPGLLASAVQLLQGNVAAARTIFEEVGRDVQAELMRPLFTQRLQQARAEAKAFSNEQKDLAKELTQALGREQELRRQEARRTNAEELKGAEALKKALESAWQSSVDGARKSRDEAKTLLEQAQAARQTAEERIEERRFRGLTPAQQQQEARDEAEEARNLAQLAASRSTLASIRGQLVDARQFAEDAQKTAARIEKFADLLNNDADAAFFIREAGKIREEALRASAAVREAEARDLDDIARQQNEQIAQAEARIQKLKEELQQPVQLDVDIERAAAEVQRLRKELETLQDKTVTVSVRTVQSGGELAPADVPLAPQFARGGFTGAGGKYQPAGIVHAGEYVLRQEVVRQPGMMRLLDRLNRDGMAALRGYSGGGAVTPINLQWPDGSSSQVSAAPDVARQIESVFKRASVRRGRQ